MKGKKNHSASVGGLSSKQLQDAVNQAYADLLLSAALDSGFLSGPRIDLQSSRETLRHGLEQSVHADKERVIEIIAEATESSDTTFARCFAMKLWDEFAHRVELKEH